MSGWLDALLGRIRKAGTELGMGYGLDFKSGLGAALNASTKFIDITIEDAAIAANHLQSQGPTGVGIPFVISNTFPALTPGTADAVTVIDSDQPEIKVIDSWFETTTAIAASAVRLHNTASGATVVYSGTLSSAALGIVRNAGPRDTDTVPAGGPVFLRRSDRGVAGTIYLLCVKA